MGQPMSLDSLAEAMRDQQNGGTEANKVVWNPRTNKFEEKQSFEPLNEHEAPLSEVTREPYFNRK